jgi:hypothetical protein
MDRKALTIAIAGLLVLGASRSASAHTIYSLSWYDSSYQLSLGDLNLSGWSYDDEDFSDYTSYVSGYLVQVREGFTRVTPVPEPSAALVFGLGLLAASRFARGKR